MAAGEGESGYDVLVNGVATLGNCVGTASTPPSSLVLKLLSDLNFCFKQLKILLLFYLILIFFKYKKNFRFIIIFNLCCKYTSESDCRKFLR